MSASARIEVAENPKQPTFDDVNRLCLRHLQCVDASAVKSSLGQNRDKLPQTFVEEILRHPNYVCWRDGRDVGLLYIEGDLGTGKTTISINIIEQLSLPSPGNALVIYFFSQGTDSRTNSIEAIIKGLILQLVNCDQELGESLRNLWDPISNCFHEDLSSWRNLWNIFLDMLSTCTSHKIYVIIDGLDECQGEEMTSFLDVLVQFGLNSPSRVKWLVTIQPKVRTDEKPTTGSQAKQLNLELNSDHVSEGVKKYAISKVAELDHQKSYGQVLLSQIETELTERAEDTFLWVYLACKSLEHVDRERALITIQCMPAGLLPLYEWRFTQVCESDTALRRECMWLLKFMGLAYRPLTLAELENISDISQEGLDIQRLVDHCAPFVRLDETRVRVVHISAREFLSGTYMRPSFDFGGACGHEVIALNCLSYLSRTLKVNIANLPEPSSRSETVQNLEDDASKNLLERMRYAATFWVAHLESADRNGLADNALAEASQFLYANFLEWIESLIILDELPYALQMLEKLSVMAASRANSSLLKFVQEGTRFILENYQIISTWPLQLYSSAIIFSPETSLVKQRNLNKLPSWMTQITQPEGSWTALIHTIAAHSKWVAAVALSPDGAHIVSASTDSTLKLWNTRTGAFEKRMQGHTGPVHAVIFSNDGQLIISGSADHTIKLWDVKTGSFQKSLRGHLNAVTALAVSQNGEMIVSGSMDKTVRVWNTGLDNFRLTLSGHSSIIRSVTISPSGKQIASSSDDKSIILWDATTGSILMTLLGHSSSVMAVAFSLDGTRIASGSLDKTIKLWSTSTGMLQQTVAHPTGQVTSLALSPDGTKIVSGSRDSGVAHLMVGSRDRTVKIWEISTGKLQRELLGHSDSVTSITTSTDGMQIVSGSRDGTIRLWDARIADVCTPAGHAGCVNAIAISPSGEKIASASRDWTIQISDALAGYENTLAGHSDWVNCVTFSPDGKHLVSGSADKTIKIWDTTLDNAKCEKTLLGHLNWVTALDFSPDGKLIASGSDDETIKLWDSTTGNLIKTLGHRLGKIDAVHFSADGTKITSKSYDGKIMLWNVTKSLTISSIFGNVIGRYFNTNQCQTVAKPSESVENSRSSRDERYVSTDLRSFEVGIGHSPKQNLHIEYLDGLHVGRRWIYHDSVPLLYLPSKFEPICYCVQGQRVAIGLKNGGVLTFCIDYRHAQRNTR